MNILLTNDDGIEAPGLAALAHSLQANLFIAAPARPMSECSHQVTTRDPLRVQWFHPQRCAIEGSPADCVRLALLKLYSNVKFDWVLSGINQGGNLGVDIFISGTVAAAREASLFQIPSIAFSQYFQDLEALRWEVSTEYARRAWAWIHTQPKLPPLHFWNINFPHHNASLRPDLVPCSPCSNPLPVNYFQQDTHAFQYRGIYHHRAPTPKSDVEHCFAGHIAISRIALFNPSSAPEHCE